MIDILACDFDGTLVPMDGGAAAAFELRQCLETIPGVPLFVINSGRMIDDLQAATAAYGLPTPDFFIGGVGTQICDHRGRMLTDWTKHLGGALDQARISAVAADFPGLELQPAHCQSDCKSSWFWPHQPPEARARLQQALQQAGLDVHLVYSSDRDLDILPSRADKAHALRWLARQQHRNLDGLVVAGDTGNDAAMFLMPEARGILVANARPELRQVVADHPTRTYAAAGEHAFGVIEGVRYFLSPQ